jgi:thioredoxin reductase (NADPH)
MKHSKVLILGSGPAGYTAAVYAARANLEPGADHRHRPRRPADDHHRGRQLACRRARRAGPGPDAALSGARRALQDRIVFDHINKVDFSKRPFTLTGDSGTYTCDSLIIATGASAKYLGLPSEQAFMGKGVSGCATCDGFFYRDQEVCVVGGGNTAVEEASVPVQHRPRCTWCTAATSSAPRPSWWTRSRQGRGRQDRSAPVHNTLDEVLGDSTGVTGVRLRSTQEQHRRTGAARAVSSPSATSPTPTSSRASWR